ncbi:MAG: CHAD domain-containing protein [Pseudomonadota bacterium]
MAFELDLEAPPGRDLRRLLHDQMGAAGSALQDTPDAEAIHATRRHLKRARAVLRLLDGDLLGPAAAADAALRDAGRHLSASRDATVLGATIEMLIGLRPPAATAQALRRWHAQLRGSTDAAIAPDTLAAACDALRQAREAAADIDPDDAAAALWAGFAASYRAGRRALRRAQAKPSARRLHDLRKALKHHVYQLRVLRPLWPAVLEAVHAEADRAAELLGEHHDCEVLRERLAGSRLRAAQQTRVDALAAQHQATLADAALACCRLIYAESARRHARRMQTYWRHGRTGA